MLSTTRNRRSLTVSVCPLPREDCRSFRRPCTCRLVSDGRSCTITSRHSLRLKGSSSCLSNNAMVSPTVSSALRIACITRRMLARAPRSPLMSPPSGPGPVQTTRNRASSAAYSTRHSSSTTPRPSVRTRCQAPSVWWGVWERSASLCARVLAATRPPVPTSRRLQKLQISSRWAQIRLLTWLSFASIVGRSPAVASTRQGSLLRASRTLETETTRLLEPSLRARQRLFSSGASCSTRLSCTPPWPSGPRSRSATLPRFFTAPP
mmetsp:Transcript_77210/g.218511  ORF Transcript_77210/g.218511 Transcript_77210/m.218511 type:complete len:264 (-) Transcript_77210:1400-2191(-)